MPVDLSPVDNLDIDEAHLDFAVEYYCANCARYRRTTSDGESESDTEHYCEYWEKPTRVESGMICAEYVPRGYE